jgi:hypothetical protein
MNNPNTGIINTALNIADSMKRDKYTVFSIETMSVKI